MKLKRWCIAIIITMLALSGYAQVISVNFSRTSFPITQVDTNIFTGVVSDLTWENVDRATGVGTQNFTTNDLDGTSLDISVSSGANMDLVIANAAWQGMANYVGIGGGFASQSVAVTLSDIPYANYYVIAYVSGYNDKSGSVTDGSVTKYFNVASGIVGTLVESTDTDSGDGIDNGSYVVFGSDEAPLTGSTKTLTMVPSAGQIVSITGFQVVEVVVPDPAVISISTTGGVVTVAASGLSASSSVTNTLQTTPDLMSGIWSNLYSVSGTVETNWNISADADQSFFRIQTLY